MTVRWESAEPVREAAAKTESSSAKQVADWSKDFYVITVSGSPMTGSRSRSVGRRSPTRID